MQELGDVNPGERRELRGFVQHRVAGEQCGNEHVAADKIRIIPRRDVGDDAERLVDDSLFELLVVEYFFVPQHRA